MSENVIANANKNIGKEPVLQREAMDFDYMDICVIKWNNKHTRK